MKKDIPMPNVVDVKVAIAKSANEKGESDWYAYLINNKPTSLNNAMIVSNASEHEGGKGRKTSTLRHMIEEVPAESFAKIERVDPAVFGFYNTFWVSFYIGKQIFDKKFSIAPFNEWELDAIKELDMDGKVTE